MLNTGLSTEFARNCCHPLTPSTHIPALRKVRYTGSSTPWLGPASLPKTPSNRCQFLQSKRAMGACKAAMLRAVPVPKTWYVAVVRHTKRSVLLRVLATASWVGGASTAACRTACHANISLSTR